MTARARYFQSLRSQFGPNYRVRVKFRQRRIEVRPTPWNTSILRDELAVFVLCVNVFAEDVPKARELANQIVLSQVPSGRERKVHFTQVIRSARSMCQLDKSDFDEVYAPE